MTKENIPTLSYETGKYPYTKLWDRKISLHKVMRQENISRLSYETGKYPYIKE